MAVDTESALCAAVWDVLGGVGGLAAGISLLMLLYLQAKPLVNRWATRRFLHATYAAEVHDLLTPGQARRLSWKPRLRHRWRGRRYGCLQRLMTLAQRVKMHQFIEAFNTARSRMLDEWAPDDVEFPQNLTEEDQRIILEAAAVSRHLEDRRHLRHRMRRHRGVRCAGGCGTRFGKRHPDHNFSGFGGIEGGWFCESNESCRDKPTGDHYCGMCTLDRMSKNDPQVATTL